MNTIKYYFILLCLTGFGLFSFIPDALGVEGRYITIGYRVVVFILSIIIIVKGSGNRINFERIKSKSVIILVLIIFYLIKLITDLYYSDLNFGRESEEILLLVLLVSFVPAYALSKMSNNIIYKSLRPLIWLFVIISGLAVSSGIVFGFNFRLEGNSILNPISIGHIAASGIILIAVEYTYSHKYKLIKYLPFLIVLLLALFMAASRGPIISLLIVLGYLFTNKVRRSFKNIFVIIPLVIAVVYISFELLESTSSILFDRMKIDVGTNVNEGEARIFLWYIGLQEFLTNPIIGGHTTTIYGYPHNILIEILMSMGIIGFSLFFWILRYTHTIISKMMKYKTPLVWVGLLWMQFFIGACFSGTIYSSNYLWYSLGLLLAIDVKSINRERITNEHPRT
jgi:hypothetical protein